MELDWGRDLDYHPPNFVADCQGNVRAAWLPKRAKDLRFARPACSGPSRAFKSNQEFLDAYALHRGVRLVLNDYVIIGGGDFAVEVVSYLSDIWRTFPSDAGTVSHVVAQNRIRLDDLSSILASTPSCSQNLDSIPALTEKLCVIAVGDPRLRYQFMREIEARRGLLGTIIHPTAYVASTAIIGEGTIICPQAFVGPFANLGRNCVVNVHCVVGHDAVLGDCAVMSPGSDVNGHGIVGDAGFLGAGAIVNPKASLGAFGKLSAGSVLNRITEEGFLMHGNPATGRQMFRRP